MGELLLKRYCFFFLAVIVLGFSVNAQSSSSQKHINVAMRMIGHQVLLNAGDSTSRVLPIEYSGNKYTISFNTDFEIIPEQVSTIIEKVLEEANVAEHYLVEVLDVADSGVVYSFEIVPKPLSEYVLPNTNVDTNNTILDFVPCAQRSLPKARYKLHVYLLDPSTIPIEQARIKSAFSIFYVVGIVFVLGLVVFFFLKRSNQSSENTVTIITLGNYSFDKQNMTLKIGEHTEVLTGKETALLTFLYKELNNTIEREVILNEIWGDEGAYVGRTLDVFISKLRKKLEEDQHVKIINIRGVGYKLILNNTAQ